MSELTLTSPAKINLYLKVLGKRKDGYHNIETVMQKINLCDTLVLKEKKRGIRIFCTNEKVPLDESNLCYQAADLLIKGFSVKKGVEIFIEKRIPVAAGLGGGSSNAASVILGLNKLWNLKINRKGLLKIGGEIGADVPFFISPFLTAKCQGKGDEISPFSFPQDLYYLLVVPDFAVSTKEIYEGLGLVARSTPLISPARKSRFKYLSATSLSPIQGTGARPHSLPSAEPYPLGLRNGFLATQPKPYNDLEKVVIKKFPLIADIKQEFERLGIKSVMSGSGPSVFGILKNGEEGRGVIAAEKKFREFGKTYICRSAIAAMKRQNCSDPSL
ncbi:MAG: 4-(cytidine 5'-diphospho)-2-C-methyl-D-erythritol kinase [Candidatus Omnitrophica bacterium 4484_213]|nr:MAG: 4-(cytidine 5'-diphospho)-2-C-methyl-D-erythritol kinase [Candidatus Omnitrophica bacterium 4484_213]